MTFSRKQAITAWLCFAVMGAMMIRPPWFWEGEPGVLNSAQLGAGYDWLWAAPPPPAEYDWKPVVWWWRLVDQWMVIAVGMVVLLFLREARDRGIRLDHGPGRPTADRHSRSSRSAVAQMET